MKVTVLLNVIMISERVRSQTAAHFATRNRPAKSAKATRVACRAGRASAAHVAGAEPCPSHGGAACPNLKRAI